MAFQIHRHGGMLQTSTEARLIYSTSVQRLQLNCTRTEEHWVHRSCKFVLLTIECTSVDCSKVCREETAVFVQLSQCLSLRLILRCVFFATKYR